MKRIFPPPAPTVKAGVFLLAVFILPYILLLVSCASPAPAPVALPTLIMITQDPNASPTPTPFQPSASLEAPTQTLTVSPTQTASPPPSPSPVLPSVTPVPPSVTPEQPVSELPTEPVLVPPTPEAPAAPARTNYVFYATLDFDAHSLDVDETIKYVNHTGIPLTDLVLSVQPNRYPGAFELITVYQDNLELTTYSLNDQRLTLNLSRALPAGASTTLGIKFRLNIPAKSKEGLFGYDFNQVDLVDWYPFVVPYENGWLLHEPVSFGEHLVYDASDFEVNLKTSPNIIVAAAAPSESNGEWTRYLLNGARTFSLSASNEFLVSESAVGSVIIRSYHFKGYEAAAEAVLYAAVQAVGIYSVKFAPYPYQTLSIVQTDIHDGMEYDGVVFIATDFYGKFGGGAKNNLVSIGVHEIAHQWWFGLVGNDQAFEPWLDEMMATYSERIFYEFNYPRYGDWWWDFRVDFFSPKGYVDTPVYNSGSFRAYTDAVYLRGAHFMEDLRVRMGDDDFYQFLQDYASTYSQQRVHANNFFETVRRHTNADISDLMVKYFSTSY